MDPFGCSVPLAGACSGLGAVLATVILVPALLPPCCSVTVAGPGETRAAPVGFAQCFQVTPALGEPKDAERD